MIKPFTFSSLFISFLMTVSIVLGLLLRVQLDHRVDTHDGDARLDGTLQLLDLAHAGLEHAGLDGVVDAALHQVETVVLVRLLLGDGLLLLVGIALLDALRESVADTQLGDEFRGVLGGVDGEGLGDDEQGLGEFTDGELLSGALCSVLDKSWPASSEVDVELATYHCAGEFLKVDVKGRLDGTTTGDNATALQRPLHCRQRVVD